MTVLRGLGQSLVPVAVVLGVFVGSAGAAGINVTAAVKHQDRIIKHSPSLKKLEHVEVSSPAQARKLIPDLRRLDKRLDRAATVVSKSTASTTQQKLGRKDWVAGTRELARGFSQLAVALKDVEHAKKTAAKQHARAAIKTIKKGGVLIAAANRALGVTTTA